MPDWTILSGRRRGPIGGAAEIQRVARIMPTPGMPERKAIARHRAHVRDFLHALPPSAQEALRGELDDSDSSHARNFV